MRPQKQTVDYFPHDSNASEGDTLTILQNYWGNDGYAFWFKLLEKLANSEGHVIDCRNPVKWELLQAKTRTDEKTSEAIMAKLAELGAIDTKLWEHKIIWSQNLVKNIADAYKNRRRELPQKPVITDDNPITTGDNPQGDGVSTGDNPQRKGKERKGKDTTTPTPSENNIFKLYEDSFGQMLTPILGDELKLLEKEYSYDWITAAFLEAVKNNVRKLSYVEAILENWKQNGKGNGHQPSEQKEITAAEWFALEEADRTKRGLENYDLG